MAIITQNHSLNIVPGVSVPVVVHVSQGDTGVALEFTLLNGSTVFDPTGKAIAAHGIREDGAGWGPVECTKVNGKIRFTLPAAATALKGSGMAEITIANGNEIVGTTNFAILVENATFPDGVTYSNDVSVYEQILAYTQSAYGSLNARIDQIVAPSGEAPNPAEILDARIGVSNVTYPNLGTAIRTQIGNLSQALNKGLNLLKTHSFSPKMTITNNKYISTGGSEEGANGYCYGVFQIAKGDKLYVYSKFTGTLGVISYSNSATPSFPVSVKVTDVGNDTVQEYTWTADADGYAIVSGLSGYVSAICVGTEMYDYIKDLLKDLSLHTYGTVITSSNYSDLLPDLNNAERNSIIIVATGLANIANAPSGVSGGTIVTMCPHSVDYTGAIQIFIPSGGNEIQFRNRWASWGDWNPVPRQAVIDNISSNLAQAQGDINSLFASASVAAMFSKVLFIGDSLTQGAYYGTPYIPKIGKNFPNMFCRVGNIGGNNEGYSGINPVNWYANKRKDNYLDWDLVILWLGTNDGLTDTLATDVDPYTDYNNYANTNTGCYCKIIESVLASNPRANIVMLNCYASSGNLVTTNTVLAEIAEKYGLPLYDTSWLSLANDPTYAYHAGVNNPHLGVFGAFVLAHRLWRFIFQYFAVHHSFLENGASAEINPTNWVYIDR